MVFQQENATMNKIQETMAISKSDQELLESVVMSADLQAKSPSPLARPGSPRWAVVRLLKRISLLKEAGEESLQKGIKHAWPEGFEEPLLLPNDITEASWQDILLKLGACEAPATLAANHFERIIQAGLDANAMHFPCMPARKAIGQRSDWAAHSRPWKPAGKHQFSRSHHTGSSTYVPSPAGEATVSPQDTIAFPFLAEVLTQWTNQEEKEVLDILLTCPAKDPDGLRPSFHSGVSFDMELMPWPSLQNGMVAADISTDAQEKVLALREKFPLSLEQLEKRRSALSKKLGGEFNRHIFAMECMPQMEFAFKPMKRSSSLSSIGSWAAVSDISWIEIESKASECGWQEVVDEQLPALSLAKPSDISKADLTEIKSMKCPPAGVCLTMEVMCVLLQVPPIKLKDGGLDFWAPSKDLLGKVDFMSRLNALVEYLPAVALDAVSPYMSLEDFTPEVVSKCSLACKALCTWARELYKYHTLQLAASEAAWQDLSSKPCSELISESQDAVGKLPKAALQELKCLAKPPSQVAAMGSCFLHLFAGIAPEIEVSKKGNVKDASWFAFQKFLANPDAALQRLLAFKDNVDSCMVPAKNVRKVREILKDMSYVFNPEAMKSKSAAAEHLCKWLMSSVAYCEHAVLVQEPDRGVDRTKPSPSQQACKHLSKADLVEIKSLSKPPQPVMTVCMCICVLLGKGEGSGWAGAKEMLSDSRLLSALLEHTKEKTTAEQIAKVRDLLNRERETMDGENMKSVSKAAYGLLQWVRAMIEDE